MARPREKHLDFFALQEAFQKAKNCAVCELEVRDLRRYFEVLLYESVNDVGVRARLVKSRGYCRRHAHLLLEQGDGQGTALIIQDQVRLLLEHLAATGKGRAGIGRKGQPRSWNVAAGCPACQHQVQRSATLLQTLAEWLDDPGLRAAIEQSPGLCAPHLLTALDCAPATGRAWLLAVHREKYAQLAAELAEFIRKHDYRFRHEGYGPEGDSWIRAVIMMSGDRESI